MDKKNMLTLRPVFSSQNSQCLVVDVSDADGDYLKNITKAIRNVLTLACSVRGGTRIPTFTLCALAKGLNELYELDSIRGNFSKILSALQLLESYEKINEHVDIQEFKDGLYMMVNYIVRKFTEKNKTLENSCAAAQIEITLITTKQPETIRCYLQDLIKDIEVSNLNKITLIQLQQHKLYNIENFPNDSAFIKTLTIKGNTHKELEIFFKYWLTEQSSDVKAILHFPGHNAVHLTIECDIMECVLNPLSLPFGHRFHLETDSLSIQFNATSISQKSDINIPVHELDVISRISVTGICESTIFGNPVCLRPTKSWSLDLEKQEDNAQLFYELYAQLAQMEQVLLVRTRSHFLTDQFLPYFIMIPGDHCFLLKSLASSDITLPWKKSRPVVTKTAERSTKIFSNLQNLELLRDIDSNNLENGLLSTLASNLQRGTKRNSNFSDFNPTIFLKKMKRSK